MLVVYQFQPAHKSPCLSCVLLLQDKEDCSEACQDRIDYLKTIGQWQGAYPALRVLPKSILAATIPAEKPLPKTGAKPNIRKRGPFYYVCRVCQEGKWGIRENQVACSGECRRIYRKEYTIRLYHKKKKIKPRKKTITKVSFREAIKIAAQTNRPVGEIL
jgi:predicted nucleic acid-binding Zn ribbon protein